MDTSSEESSGVSASRYQLAYLAVSKLPDRCALDVGALAERIGTDKLELITWIRADIDFARLISSKVTT